MMSKAGYVVLAITTLAIGTAANESKSPEAAKAERDAWAIAWSVALWDNERKSNYSRRPDRRDAREVYGDAWEIYKRARAIYEADRERQVVAA